MRFFLTVVFLFVATPLVHALPQPPALMVGDATATYDPLYRTARISARIVNPASQSIVVEAITSPIAARHKMVVYGRDTTGAVTLTETTTLTLPPGETLLIPNVLELRLLDTTTELQPQTEIPLFFHFENGTRKTFRATVTSTMR